MDRPLDLTAPAVDGEPADRMRVLLVEDDDGDALIVTAEQVDDALGRMRALLS